MSRSNDFIITKIIENVFLNYKTFKRRLWDYRRIPHTASLFLKVFYPDVGQ